MSSENEVFNTGLPSDFELTEIPRPAILLVDDREENLVATRKILSRLDADIVCASSGAEALSHSLRQDFAVILLDVQMPIMDGFETADLLRQTTQTEQTPIIFVTAISKEDRYVRDGYEAGALDYIFKPLDASILQSKVKVFLDMARQKMILKRLLSRLEQLNTRHSLLLECAAEGILGVGPDGCITFANPAAQNLLGAVDQLVGTPVLAYLDGPATAPDAWAGHRLRQVCLAQTKVVEVDTTLYRLDGISFPAGYSFAPLPALHGLSGAVILFQNKFVQKQLFQKLEHIAMHDELTGLANRRMLSEYLSHAVARALRSGHPVALLHMDLDGFKAVNDQYGYHMGDILLQAFADRLTTLSRAGDLLARVGDDEFVLLLADGSSLQEAECVAQKIISSCADAYPLEGVDVVVGVSMGLAVCPAHADTVDGLLKAADQAMYVAKAAGRNQCVAASA